MLKSLEAPIIVVPIRFIPVCFAAVFPISFLVGFFKREGPSTLVWCFVELGGWRPTPPVMGEAVGSIEGVSAVGA